MVHAQKEILKAFIVPVRTIYNLAWWDKTHSGWKNATTALRSSLKECHIEGANEYTSGLSLIEFAEKALESDSD